MSIARPPPAPRRSLADPLEEDRREVALALERFALPAAVDEKELATV
jgi:hypothetical protein